VHSGAFAKYVGRLDLVARRDDEGRLRIRSHDYTLFPVDSTVPEDPELAQLMEEYRLELNQHIDLTSVYGYSPKLLTKYGYEGGDSSLGNLVSEAIRKYARVDIAFTNTLGIRANMYPGPITLDDLFNIFPFENSITLMYMSGTDLRAMLDYVAQRSSGRGCVSQLQVAGVQFVMNCNPDPPPAYSICHGCSEDHCLVECTQNCGGDKQCHLACVETYKECVLDKTKKLEDQLCLDRCMPYEPIYYNKPVDDQVKDCWHDCFPRAEDISLTDCPDPMAVEDISTCNQTPLVEHQVYEVATNDYIAHGGSGFTILKSNNTQEDTGLPLREAVLEVILTAGECLEFCLDRDGDLALADCSVYQGCLEAVSEFYDGFCEKLDKTGGTEIVGAIQGCAVDTGSCYYDSHCYFPELDCLDGSCKSCKTSAECLAESPNTFCVDGLCVPRTHVCVDGRCVRGCEEDADCPGGDSDRELLCVRNRCEPRPAISCLSSVECANPYQVCFGDSALCTTDQDCPLDAHCRQRICVPDRAACQDDEDCGAGQGCLHGLCSGDKVACDKHSQCGAEGKCLDGVCSTPCGNCEYDENCPDGLVCIKNFCVHLNATCDGFRCRTHCTTDGQCKSGEHCAAGLCQPSLCSHQLSAEKACRLNSAWRANQKCSHVACVDSRVDGRIGRILPENLGDLEFGFVPENPEDIDYE